LDFIAFKYALFSCRKELHKEGGGFSNSNSNSNENASSNANSNSNENASSNANSIYERKLCQQFRFIWNRVLATVDVGTNKANKC